MSVVIVTGSSGLVGSAAVGFFSSKGFDVVGIDNDTRKFLFGPSGSTIATREKLKKSYPSFKSLDIDIRDVGAVCDAFRQVGDSLSGVIHCAAQPSHDWAARNPRVDFEINALGTLNLLEAAREFSPDSPFIFMSTNKVYGDLPNKIDFVEEATRWSPVESRIRTAGFDESLSIDQSTHSLFGVSKASADLLVQEYGRYWGMKTVAFRGGCLTGPDHAGVELHGFLSYLVKCVVHGKPYTVFGHKGKQVRDNIHTDDLVSAFWFYFQSPTAGAVYNIGGGSEANVSLLEAIAFAQEYSGRKLEYVVDERARVGDHRWYVSDLSAFKQAYPDWLITRDLPSIIVEMVDREMRTEK